MPEDESAVLPEEEPFSLGGGVLPVIPEMKEKEDPDEAEKEKVIDRDYAEEVQGGHKVIKNRDGRVKWGTMPQKVGMLQDTNMYRTGPPQCKIFVLPEDLDAYNAFLRRSGNTGVNMDGDPEMMLETNHEEFYEGKFYVRITYREIFYRQLFDTK